METRSRPGRVTLLALGVLSIGGLNLLRCFQAVRQWTFLEALLPVSPLYLALSGLFWAVVWLALAWGLWGGRRWAQRFSLLAALFYTLYFWVDRLLLSAEGAGSNWPFVAGLNVALLVLLGWILFSPRSIDFFQTGAAQRSRYDLGHSSQRE